MTKAELVNVVSSETGIIRKDVTIAVDAFLESVKDSLKEGKHIEIRGFGTFKVKIRNERIGRNPKTETKVIVPARVVPAFKFSKTLKDDVNKANSNLIK